MKSRAHESEAHTWVLAGTWPRGYQMNKESSHIALENLHRAIVEKYENLSGCFSIQTSTLSARPRPVAITSLAEPAWLSHLSTGRPCCGQQRLTYRDRGPAAAIGFQASGDSYAGRLPAHVRCTGRTWASSARLAAERSLVQLEPAPSARTDCLPYPADESACSGKRPPWLEASVPADHREVITMTATCW